MDQFYMSMRIFFSNPLYKCGYLTWQWGFLSDEGDDRLAGVLRRGSDGAVSHLRGRELCVVILQPQNKVIIRDPEDMQAWQSINPLLPYEGKSKLLYNSHPWIVLSGC